MARLRPTRWDLEAAQKERSFNPIVSSHGYSDAQIMFLQGFPLKDDLLQQKALSGSSERTIKEFLNEQKIKINHTYRAIFLREKLEYSATNPKKLRIAMSKLHLEKYEELLLEDILHVKPNVIVPLDDIALGAVFPHIKSIHKPKGRKYWLDCYRGSILPLREDWQQKLGLDNYVRVIPTIGPQLLYSNFTARAYVNLDYKRIVENKDRRSPIEEYGKIWVARSYETFRGFLERQYANRPTRVTFDIETYGGMITCISFCFDGYESVTVPLLDPAIPSLEMAALWKLISKVMKDPLIEKNNQNIKYDWTILERHGFLLNNVRSDTMLKGSLLYPELPKGLDFWTSIYTPIPYYKDEGKEYNPRLHGRDRLYFYCAKDSLAAHIISREQDKELEESGQKEFYETEIAPSLLIYKDIDRTGILIDEFQKRKLLAKYNALYELNLNTLRGLVGDPNFNPRSNPQVGKLLYEDLRFPMRRKIDPETGRMSYKTDKETLDDLLVHHGENNRGGRTGYTIVSRVIVSRKLSKVIEYIDTPLHPDNRFRGTSNLAGTETGRSSSSKTIDERLRAEFEIKDGKLTKRLGRSLQTISKHGFVLDDEIFDDFEDASIAQDIRSMFVPSRNCLFIEGDGAGAEARIVFVLAEDWDGLTAMDQKPKIHAKTAAAIFNIDVNCITSKSPAVPKLGIAYYDLGKRIRHAGNYDMTAFRLYQMTHLPLNECEKHLNKFHQIAPRIRGTFHAGIIQCIRLHRELITPFGRKRTFFGEMNDHLFKEAFAQIPQSSISDLTKFTMWRIKDNLPGYYEKYRFLSEMHDGILAEVHKDYAEPYQIAFKKYYERPINFRNCSLSRDFELTIPTELSMSATNWQELKEIHL